jgi:hypothetical protein
MITINKLDTCIKEAERFYFKALECRDKLKSEDCDLNRPSITGSKQTGAVRRASLDLSRALSDLRNSKWETK